MSFPKLAMSRTDLVLVVVVRQKAIDVRKLYSNDPLCLVDTSCRGVFQNNLPESESQRQVSDLSEDLHRPTSQYEYKSRANIYHHQIVVSEVGMAGR